MLTPRLAEYLDWSRALALWGLPVLLALGWLAWRVPCPPACTPAPTGEQRLHPRPHLAAHRLFGIINSGCGIVVAWLAPAYMAAGWSAQQGGELVAWLALAPDRERPWPALLAAGRLDPPPLDGAGHRHAAGGLWRPLARSPRPPPALVFAVRRRAWGASPSSW